MKNKILGNARLAQFVSKTVSLVIGGTSLLLVAGCAPRGESHTVEQILTDARNAYQSVSASYSGDVAPSLKTLSGALDRLAGIGGGGDAKQVSQEIAQQLTTLSGKIGYTSRAAMAELVQQYTSVAQDSSSGASLGAPNLKLLAARTYTLVTSELKTTKFKVS
jgi:hypothetical protein